MAEMIQATIDGREIQVRRDTTILEAARTLGIEIPTFCHREPLEPYGACRICIVEVDEGKRTRVVPSCVYPIRGPVTVRTNTEKILRHRRMLVQLELARCSEDPHVIEIARRLGVDAPHPRMTRGKDDCIVCGLCVRVCREVVGAHAIGFEGRGKKRRPTPPFDAENPACIACGACAYVCPTQCIGYFDQDGKRVLPRWKRAVPLDQLDQTAFQLLPLGVQPGKPVGLPSAKERAQAKK